MIAYEPIVQPLHLHDGYQTDVLRLDLLHPEISGNKWFKLKYNLEKALTGNFETIVTFGGAFSNHLAATAAACKLYRLKSIAIIRGEAPVQLNATLKKAVEDGMQLHFVSREQYAQKTETAFNLYLTERFGRYYLIPEGGNNEAGMLGCKDILKPEWDYDYIFCACGTATTFSGLVAFAKPGQSVIGISVLKGKNTLPAEVSRLLDQCTPDNSIHISGGEVLEGLQAGAHCITNAYCFSGYAKFDKACVDFKTEFEKKYDLPLDHIYTTKLFYGVNDLINTNQLRAGSKILIVHSGGLQGNAGFEERYHRMPSL